MPTPTVKIGGKAYSSNDVQIFFLGRLCRGVLEIEFDSEQSVEDVFIVGQKEPVDFLESNRKHNASITILMDELIGLEISANGNILDLSPFDITITFTKLPLVAQQRLVGFKPKGRALSVKAGGSDALSWKIPGRCQAIPAMNKV